MQETKIAYTDSMYNLSEDRITSKKLDDDIKMKLQKVDWRLVTLVQKFKVLLCEG
jgi:hypothetical protein